MIGSINSQWVTESVQGNDGAHVFAAIRQILSRGFTCLEAADPAR